MLGFGPGETVFAGDSGNDLEVLTGPVPAVLVHGARDASVPVSQSRAYVTADRDAGGVARLVEVAGDDHFALLDPSSATFEATHAAIRDLLAAG